MDTRPVKKPNNRKRNLKILWFSGIILIIISTFILGFSVTIVDKKISIKQDTLTTDIKEGKGIKHSLNSFRSLGTRI